MFNGKFRYTWPFSKANYVKLPEGRYVQNIILVCIGDKGYLGFAKIDYHLKSTSAMVQIDDKGFAWWKKDASDCCVDILLL